jgi:hypothetical protein
MVTLIIRGAAVALVLAVTAAVRLVRWLTSRRDHRLRWWLLNDDDEVIGGPFYRFADVAAHPMYFRARLLTEHGSQASPTDQRRWIIPALMIAAVLWASTTEKHPTPPTPVTVGQ